MKTARETQLSISFARKQSPNPDARWVVGFREASILPFTDDFTAFSSFAGLDMRISISLRPCSFLPTLVFSLFDTRPFDLPRDGFIIRLISFLVSFPDRKQQDVEHELDARRSNKLAQTSYPHK